MYFTQEDEDMLDGTVQIMTKMFKRLRDVPVEKARRDISKLDEKMRQKYCRKDRKDTYFFDVVAEDAISIGDGFSGHLDLFQRILGQTGVIITEECGRVPREIRIEHNTPVIISDPVDSSAYIDKMIKEHSKGGKNEKMGTVFDRELRRVGEEAARTYAPNSSVTHLRDNMIKYTVVMNMLTGDVYVGSPLGVYSGSSEKISSAGDIDNEVEFVEDENLTLLCYTRKGKYEKNRTGTHLRFFPLHESAITSPGPIGPMRFVNLVKFDSKEYPIGVVAHNGEKIQEALPNVAVALFSGGRLLAYKLFSDPEYIEHRAGKALTPNLANSLYSDGLLVNTGIKSEFLNNHPYPSEFRDTTAIISAENESALTMLSGMVGRKYAAQII